MCGSCWEEAGSPKINNKRVRVCAHAIERLYEVNCVGGNAHVVTDDFNVEDIYIQGCIERAEPWYDTMDRKDADSSYVRSLRVLHLMENMSEQERMSAITLAHGYWEIEESHA